jgi:hypothetical protein
MLLGTEHIWIIDDFDPVRIQYQTQTVSNQEFALFLSRQSASITDAMKRKTTTGAPGVILIADAPTDTTLSSVQRRMQAEWLKEHEAALRLTCVATYIVVPHALRRGVMTAVLWLVRPPIEVHACASIEEAAAQALRLADATSLPVPALFRADPGGVARRAIERVAARRTCAE